MSTGSHGSGSKRARTNSTGNFSGREEPVEAGVDARGVGAQRVAQAGIGSLPFPLRGAMQAESALEAIDVERILAEDLGQPPGGHAAGQLHLPQAILGVAEALAEVRVQRVARADVGNAPAVADDLDRPAQARDAQLAVQLAAAVAAADSRMRPRPRRPSPRPRRRGD